VSAPRWKLLALRSAPAVLALGCAAGAIVIPFPQKVLFLFGAALFGLVTFTGLTLWRRGANTIVAVTDEGLDVAVGFLSWDEIERIEMTSVAGNRALGIWTIDPFVLARRGRSPWLWLVGFLARMQGGPLIAYADSAVPIDELYGQIELRRTQASTPTTSRLHGTVSTSSD
jgi:hypothetical protein